MKKVILLMAIGFIAISAFAQELGNKSVIFDNATISNLGGMQHYIPVPKAHKGEVVGSKSGARTTSTAPRWFSYVSYWGTIWTNTSISGWPLWNDTTAYFGYSGTPNTFQYNEWTSYGVSFNPVFSGFSDTSVWGSGIINITNTDAYTIDSIRVSGYYARAVAKPLVVDTLVFSLIYGNGSGTSDNIDYYFTGFTTSYGMDTVNFLSLAHDSLHNCAGKGTGSVAPYIFKVPIHSTDTGNIYQNDTSSFFRSFALPTPLTVPAGNKLGASISFISGDTAYHVNGLGHGDTVQYPTGSVKYSVFYQDVVYKSTGGANPTAQFPTYSPTDLNSGCFKREGARDGGWGGLYIPNWAWTTGGGTGASALQFPYIDFLISCPTCINLAVKENNSNNTFNVAAAPNPAINAVSINFDLSAVAANTTVSLTNLVGQVIATENITNVNHGNVTFNTNTIPSGIYFYTVQTSNGDRNTGRIVVAH